MLHELNNEMDHRKTSIYKASDKTKKTCLPSMYNIIYANKKIVRHKTGKIEVAIELG